MRERAIGHDSQTPIYDQLCMALAQKTETEYTGRRRASESGGERAQRKVPEQTTHSVSDLTGNSGRHRRPNA